MYTMIRELYYYISSKSFFNVVLNDIEHGQRPLNQGHNSEGQNQRPISQG